MSGLYGIPKTYKARAAVYRIGCVVEFYLAFLFPVWTGDRCPLLAHNNLRGRGRRASRRLVFPAKKITGK